MQNLWRLMHLATNAMPDQRLDVAEPPPACRFFHSMPDIPQRPPRAGSLDTSYQRLMGLPQQSCYRAANVTYRIGPSSVSQPTVLVNHNVDGHNIPIMKHSLRWKTVTHHLVDRSAGGIRETFIALLFRRSSALA
ncbi:hypothetical protein D3C73_1311810 [compost metagenome]